MVVGSVLDVRCGRRYENFFGIPVPIIPWLYLKKTAPGGEDAVVTRVKGYIDAGTCDSVSFSAEYSAEECGNGAPSYYREFEYAGKRVIISNNVSH